MYYYINVSFWELQHTFVTESISPKSFYLQQDFNLDYKPEGDTTDYLLLSTLEMDGEYTLKVDKNLLDESCLLAIDDSGVRFAYPKSIFYNKGQVFFGFASEKLKRLFIARAEMQLEVKCVEKYLSEFYLKNSQGSHLNVDVITGDASFIKNYQSLAVEEVKSENLYNKIKGAIVGFMVSVIERNSPKKQDATNQIKSIKNAFTGIHTAIMVNNSAISEEEMNHLSRTIDSGERAYRLLIGETNRFVILRQYLIELYRLSNLRVSLISSLQLSTADFGFENSLKREINNVEEELPASRSNEAQKERPNSAKSMHSKGSTRDRYKKSLRIKEKDLLRKLQESKAYDGTITTLFLRVSDISNELLEEVGKLTSSVESFSYPFLVDRQRLRIENIPNVSNAELDFCNIVVNIVVHMSSEKISDEYILNLITISANKFKQSMYSRTPEGSLIINCLREYWMYKHHKTLSFEIPEGLMLFSSLMGFFIKPFGFDQMGRYLDNRGIVDQRLAFLLWGAAIGYAAIPKTFTSLLYRNESYCRKLDGYLLTIRKSIGSSCNGTECS